MLQKEAVLFNLEYFLLSGKALSFASRRLIKMNNARGYKKRFEKILQKVQNKPEGLFINVFDEAHHGATANDEKPGKTWIKQD